MHLGKKNPGHTYNMNGKQLETVKEHKDLGVLIDSELKFITIYVMLPIKDSQVLSIIEKSFTYLDSYIYISPTIQIFGVLYILKANLEKSPHLHDSFYTTLPF